MNQEAVRHLDKAEELLGRGEEFYRKAAAEIVAAKQADDSISNAEIGERFGRSKTWVGELVRWYTSDPHAAPPTPYSRDVGKVERATTKRVLAKASPEEVEELLADLPEEKRLEVAGAALEPTRKEGARQKQDRKAVRAEQSADPGAAQYQIVMLDLAKVDQASGDATGVARDATFSDEQRQRLNARVGVSLERLDVLRLAISGSEDVDWDAELARLTEKAEELTEGV